MKKSTTSQRAVFVLSDENIVAFRNLLVRWDFKCIICGEEFDNIACVTREHIVPKSFNDDRGQMLKKILTENRAPAHFTCNGLRGNGSIMDAQRAIHVARTTMTPEAFYRWLNRPVPNRYVDPKKLRIKVAQSFSLPERLPGME